MSDKATDRDHKARNSNGVIAVTSGVRTVRNGEVSINGDRFVVRGFAKSLEGVKVRIRVLDYLASEYDLLDCDGYHRVGIAVWKGVTK